MTADWARLPYEVLERISRGSSTRSPGSIGSPTTSRRSRRRPSSGSSGRYHRRNDRRHRRHTRRCHRRRHRRPPPHPHPGRVDRAAPDPVGTARARARQDARAGDAALDRPTRRGEHRVRRAALHLRRPRPGAALRDDPARWLSVGYLALVREEAPAPGARWVDVYDLFPWEDHREGRPRMIDDVLLPALDDWAAADAGAAVSSRRERIAVMFGREAGWDGIRVLERYELLYEAGLVAEAQIDAGEAIAEAPGRERRWRSTTAGSPPPRWAGCAARSPTARWCSSCCPDRFTLSALQRTRRGVVGGAHPHPELPAPRGAQPAGGAHRRDDGHRGPSGGVVPVSSRRPPGATPSRGQRPLPLMAPPHQVALDLFAPLGSELRALGPDPLARPGRALAGRDGRRARRGAG